MTFLRISIVLLLTAFAMGIASEPATAQGAKSAPSDWLAPFRASLMPAPAAAEIKLRQSVYVPAYSTLVGSGGAAQLKLAVTLSVRNTSADVPLVVERIDYYDTAGNLVQRYIPPAIAVRPFGTIEILIPTNDVRGGSGANFVVDWGATQPISEPVIETVMVGASGTRGFAFVSPGHPIRVLER